MVADALSKKDKEPIRVRALVVKVHNNLPEQIRNAQAKACDKENIGAEGFVGEGEPFEVRADADIATYVRKCLTCAKVKAEHQDHQDCFNNLKSLFGSGKELHWISLRSFQEHNLDTIQSGSSLTD
uniref:Reverse transcriptase domain-containing protein n=1 Tax=Tanacetum cinerariifolium TaxID=118510 RepID=A0A699UJG9_TANCI|nr:hypothetical protein [Tanacetum cinerariifolium]